MLIPQVFLPARLQVEALLTLFAEVLSVHSEHRQRFVVNAHGMLTQKKSRRVAASTVLTLKLPSAPTAHPLQWHVVLLVLVRDQTVLPREHVPTQRAVELARVFGRFQRLHISVLTRAVVPQSLVGRIAVAARVADELALVLRVRARLGLHQDLVHLPQVVAQRLALDEALAANLAHLGRTWLVAAIPSRLLPAFKLVVRVRQVWVGLSFHLFQLYLHLKPFKYVASNAADGISQSRFTLNNEATSL